MTSLVRSTVIRTSKKGKCGSTGGVKGNSTTYMRRNNEEMHEVHTEELSISTGPSSSDNGGTWAAPSTSTGDGSLASESHLMKDNEVNVIPQMDHPKVESIVHLRDSGEGAGGTIVSLSPPSASGVQTQPHGTPSALPALTNLSMKRQLTRPEKHGVRSASDGMEGGGAGEVRVAHSSTASYSRAVASEREAAVTVTVYDTSSVDSPLLSPHRPLLHSPNTNQDSKLIKVEIVGAQNMDLDSGGRFERRTTIIDRLVYLVVRFIMSGIEA
ncbi:uncharacterized protein [Cherax quadricarinatus]|uniref:uncharacterized protein n=1 Tax=Cherax quadricarinatus TaxID=27406 RepID=UPI00387EAA23